MLTSILLLAQPVATLLLGIVLISERPSGLQAAGVLVVLLGLLVASGWRARTDTPPTKGPDQRGW